MTLAPKDAERLLYARYVEPAKSPTKYVVGFHTPTGKVLAIHRTVAETMVWFQPPNRRALMASTFSQNRTTETTT